MFGNKVDEGQWIETQKAAFTSWINSILIEKNEYISGLEELTDGTKLCLLIEMLTKEPLPKKPKVNATHPLHRQNNITIALDVMKDKGLETKFCSAKDIADGNTKLLLGLIWRVILHFQFQIFGNENKNIKEQLMTFVRDICDKYDYKIDNFTTSFSSGVPLNALLAAFDSSIVDMEEVLEKSKKKDSKICLELNKDAIKIAKETFKIPSIIEPEVITNSPEELSIITYLSYYYEYYKKNITTIVKNLNLSFSFKKNNNNSFKSARTTSFAALKSPKSVEIVDIFTSPKKKEIIEDDEIEKDLMNDQNKNNFDVDSIKEELQKLKFEKSILEKKLEDTHSKLENEIQAFEINLNKIRSESKLKVMNVEIENQKKEMEESQQAIIDFNHSLSLLEERNRKLQEKEDLLQNKLKLVEDQLKFLDLDKNQIKKGRKGPYGEVTLVFTDVQDSTSLWEMSSPIMQKSLKIHNQEIRKVIEETNGFEVKTEGDAFMCAFDSAMEAINFALLVQIRLMKANWPEEVFKHKSGQIEKNDKNEEVFKGFRVRMGIHTGFPIVEVDPTTDREDYFGPMVNRSARVESKAKGGMIVISDSTYQKIKDKQNEFNYPIFIKDMGEVSLKGLKTPEHIRMILPESLSKRVFPNDEVKTTTQKMNEGDLKNLKSNIQKENSIVKKQSEENNSKIQKTNWAILKKQSEIKTLTERVSQMTKEFEDIKKEQEKFTPKTNETSISDLKYEYEKLKDQLTEKDKVVSREKGKKEEIENKYLETKKKLNDETENFQTTLEKFQNESKMKIINLKLEQQQQIIDQFQNSILDFNRQINEANEQNRKLQQRESELQNQLQLLEDQLKFYEKEKYQFKKGRKGPYGEVTLVFTDVQDSTSLWEMSSSVMQKSLKIHNQEIRKVIEETNGFEVKTEGDAFMCAFDSAIEAINFALLVQIRLMEANWPEEVFKHKSGKIEKDDEDKTTFKGFRVRMGIHTGSPIVEVDPTTDREDYFGPMVNKSARVESKAKGGMIVISDSTYQKVKDDQSNFIFPVFMKDMGEVSLKGLKEPEHIRMILPKALSKRKFPDEPIVEKPKVSTLSDFEKLRNQFETESNSLKERIDENKKTIFEKTENLNETKIKMNSSIEKQKNLSSQVDDLMKNMDKSKKNDESIYDLQMEIENLRELLSDNEEKYKLTYDRLTSQHEKEISKLNDLLDATNLENEKKLLMNTSNLNNKDEMDNKSKQFEVEIIGLKEKLEKDKSDFEIKLQKVKNEANMKMIQMEIDNQNILVQQSKSTMSQYNESLEKLKEKNEELQKNELELKNKLKLVEDQLNFHENDKEHINKGRKGPYGEVTLVFTDVQDSTSLWEMSSSVMQQSLKIHNQEIRKVIEETNGFEVKTEGDAFMCAFDSAMEAINFALLVQIRLMKANWPEEVFKHKSGQIEKNDKNEEVFKGFRVRMGIHTGFPIVEVDPTTDREDYFGPMVNRSARVESKAKGGMIVISDSTYQKIKDKQNEFNYPIFIKDMGEVSLKGLKTPEHIRMILPESLSKRIWEKMILPESLSKRVFPNDSNVEQNSKLLHGTSLEDWKIKLTKWAQKSKNETDENSKSISTMKDKISKEQEEYEDLMRKKENLEKEIEKLKEEQLKLSTNSTWGSSSDLSEEIDKLKDEIKENKKKHEIEIKELKSRLNEKFKKEKENLNEEMKKEIENLRIENELKIKQEEEKKLKNIEKSEEKMKKLKEENENLKVNKELENENKSKWEEIRKLKRENENLEETLLETEKEEISLKSKLKNLNSSFKEIELKNEEKNEEIESLKEKLRKLTQDIKNQKEKFENDIQNVKIQNDTIIEHEMNEKIFEIKDNFENQIKNLNDANEQIIKSLKNEHENEIKQLKKKKKEIDSDDEVLKPLKSARSTKSKKDSDSDDEHKPLKSARSKLKLKKVIDLSDEDEDELKPLTSARSSRRMKKDIDSDEDRPLKSARSKPKLKKDSSDEDDVKPLKSARSRSKLKKNDEDDENDEDKKVKKNHPKFSKDQKSLIKKWIEKVTKKKFENGDDFVSSLKDGVLLCELSAKIKGRFVAYNKNPRGLDWMENENVVTFKNQIEKFGVKSDVLTVNDETINELIAVLFELSKVASLQPKFKGPNIDEL
eukprot:gene4149-7459_t